MATFNPKLSLSAAPGITGHLYLVLYEATAPTAPVANSGQIAPPHTSSVQIQFNGLNPVIHIAKLFETNGVSTSGTLLANFSLDPQFPVVELRTPLFIYAGSTAGFAVGDNKYIDPATYLKGWDYVLKIRGIGELDPAVDYTVDTDNNPTITSGTVFNPGTYATGNGEVWLFEFLPKLITYNPVSNTMISATELIDADRVLVAADIGKSFLCQGSASTLQITLPSLALVPVNKPTFFLIDGGFNPNTVFLPDGSDSILFGETITKLILARSERLWLYKWDNGSFASWYVMNDIPGAKSVGQVIHSYETALYNTVYANGQVLARDVYPRLWDYVSTRLDASMLVSDATWTTAVGGFYPGKALYSTGNGSTTFRVPQLYTYGFLRSVDESSRKAGQLEDEMVGPHSHAIEFGWNGTDGTANGQHIRQSSSDNSEGQGTGVNSYAIQNNSGTENRPANTGIYLSIRI